MTEGIRKALAKWANPLSTPTNKQERWTMEATSRTLRLPVMSIYDGQDEMMVLG